MAVESTAKQDGSTQICPTGPPGSIGYQCCATARSTGKRCKLPVVKGRNFCGIHAGVYIPGQKKGAKPRLKHGFYSDEAYRDRKDARQAIRAVNIAIGAILEEISDKQQGATIHENIR